MALSSRPRPRARGRLRVAVITDALSEATAQAVGTPSAPGDPGPVVAALRTLGYDPILVEFNGDPSSGWPSWRPGASSWCSTSARA